MFDRLAKLGVMGFIAVAVVATAVFCVCYSVLTGTETETTKMFATALAGPGIGGLLVAAGRFFGASTQ